LCFSALLAAIRLRLFTPFGGQPVVGAVGADQVMANAACRGPVASTQREGDMAQREQKGNREAKKPKKEKIKTIAAPSQKGGTAPSW
jgi:hypothetical protein